MGRELQHCKLVLWKNFLISKRTKEYLRENISVVILGIFIVAMESQGSNFLLTPFYMSMAVIGFTRATAINWVEERETRQKELQKIMGMTSIGYTAGWIIYMVINALFVCLFMLLIFHFGVLVPNPEFRFEPGYGFHHIILIYIAYAMSIIGFVLILCSFFDKAKTAAQGIIFIQIMLNFLYLLRLADFFRKSQLLITAMSIFPQIAFNIGISKIAFQKGFPEIQFSYERALFILVCTAIIFPVIAFYLDNVLPNELGIQRHPLFFLDCIFKKKKAEEKSELIPLLEDNRETSAEYEQIKRNVNEPLIKISNVNKDFGDLKAVSDLTLNFYPNEIFCLLGHNGAGKSTTINLLTGILPITKGKIEIMGLNYEKDLNQIRNNIGLCLQYNVLYQEMTIEQHLKYYASMKGIQSQDLQNEIETIINECQLTSERGKLSKNLSGGNKRKLSLGNALIGKSKIIFLDEPSSGLDPNSRQGIWKIMKNMKSENRCIILTTHHLEEAEELSQKIGIMAEGKLIIIGDNTFIKEKFGVGYHVILTFKEGQKQQMSVCEQIVLKTINGSKRDEQTALNTLKFILPQNQSPKFGKLFFELQKMADISVKMSDLQDAFIKIGSNDKDEEAQNQVPELVLPDISCSYSFFSQFKAVFNRKALTTTRSLSGIVSIILPIILIGLGVLLVCLAFKGDEKEVRYVRRALMCNFFIWAYVFTTSSYCGDLVLEREKKFKYLSNVMGLRKMPYWAANYCFDLCIFLIPLFVFFMILLALGKEGKFLIEVSQYLIPLLILFGFSFIGYSYLFSFMFQKSSTAFRLFPFFNLMFFFLIPSIATLVAPNALIAQRLNPLFSPFMAFHNGFLSKQIIGINITNGFISKSLTYDYFCLVFQAVFFFIATLFVQNLRMKLKDREELNEQDALENGSIVQQQQHGKENDINNIEVDQLFKKYSNGFKAIRGTSFSVEKGEIFGLLGPNGAGKSTTFNIITAYMSKTSGEVKLFGEDVKNVGMKVFQDVGVCPQYDSLYEVLTTEEHLLYFCRLKGLNTSEMGQAIDYYVQLLSLESYKKTRAGVLSGGNKRKLMVSMSMLANPSVMFFDEPSAGVDPISRRFLWRSLSLATRTKGTSMVLTTHTMSEAESLCSRIGILIKGKFVSVATPLELKKKYGKGFQIKVELEEGNKKQVIEVVRKDFKGEVQIQDQQNCILFVIQSNSFKYSTAYQIFQQMMLKGLLKSYKIQESTLEEVFLYLSQLQPEMELDQLPTKEPWEFCCWECGANGCQCLM